MSFLTAILDAEEPDGGTSRYLLLLVSLLVLLVAPSMARAVGIETHLFHWLLCLVLSASIYLHSQNGWAFAVALAVGGSGILGLAAAEVTHSATIALASNGLVLLLLTWTTSLLLRVIARTRRVSRDTILGGLCAYMLIGICFGVAYNIMTDLQPGALLDAGEPIVTLRGGHEDLHEGARLLYFSFVTLTTLGYGDITPASELARTFSVLEALIGQAYIATFLAQLISIRSSGGGSVAEETVGEPSRP